MSTSLALAACGPAEDPAPASTATSNAALRAWNGRAWNGRAWNGRAWNGRAWNGRAWNGTSLGANGIDGTGWRVVVGGQEISPAAVLSLSGSRLLFGGQDLSATTSSVDVWPAGLPELHFRIDGPFPLTTSVGIPTGVDTYEVFVEQNGALEPMFVDADGAAVRSIPLVGEWNEDPAAAGTPSGGAWSDGGRITFGARGYALAKCVELGYQPWAVAPDLHRACVRMMRADYCGDGTTWTVNGTMLNMYDASGVQARDTTAPVPGDPTWAWAFEAEWTEAGAVCVDDFRVASLGPVSACVTGRTLTENKCGKIKPHRFGAFGTARIMSEFASQ